MSLFNMDPDTIPRGPFEMLSWRLTSLSKGIEYADMELKMQRMKEREQTSSSYISITYIPTRHYPVRAHRRHP